MTASTLHGPAAQAIARRKVLAYGGAADGVAGLTLAGCGGDTASTSSGSSGSTASGSSPCVLSSNVTEGPHSEQRGGGGARGAGGEPPSGGAPAGAPGASASS